MHDDLRRVKRATRGNRGGLPRVDAPFLGVYSTFIALSRLTMPKYAVFYSDSNEFFFYKLLGTVVRVRPPPRLSVAVSFLQFYTVSKNHMSLGHL